MDGLVGTKGLGCGSPPASKTATLALPRECMIKGTANPLGGAGSSPIWLPVTLDSAITDPFRGFPTNTISFPPATPAMGASKFAYSKLSEWLLAPSGTTSSIVLCVTIDVSPHQALPHRHKSEHAINVAC